MAMKAKSVNFKLNFCTFQAAKYAVENWHYSQNMPNGKLFTLGVWEEGKFIGAIVFGRGANNNMLKPYGLDVTEGCELVRIALKEHKTPVSKIVKVAILMLKRFNPKLKMIVSYADTAQDHLGVIYQASNWIYTGSARSTNLYLYNGRYRHQRSINLAIAGGKLNREQANQLPQLPASNKHRYIYILDDSIKDLVLKLKKPYPKRQELESKASSFQDEEGGAVPTLTHQEAKA